MVEKGMGKKGGRRRGPSKIAVSVIPSTEVGQLERQIEKERQSGGEEEKRKTTNPNTSYHRACDRMRRDTRGKKRLWKRRKKRRGKDE